MNALRSESESDGGIQWHTHHSWEQSLNVRKIHALITGAGAYVGDLKLPGMHHVAFVRSPYAHATIGTIHTESALTMPGVVAVIAWRRATQILRANAHWCW